MIEFCTKRRMILSVIVLGLLTVLVLILEEVLTSGIRVNEGHVENTTKRLSIQAPSEASPTSANGNQPLPDSKKRVCWLHEEYKVIQDCAFCTDFELNSKTPAACTETGMKETLRCKSAGTVYRSCTRVLGLEKRRFWIFQSLMLLSLVISYGVVKFRWSQLERKTIDTIQRRLAAGH